VFLLFAFCSSLSLSLSLLISRFVAFFVLVGPRIPTRLFTVFGESIGSHSGTRKSVMKSDVLKFREMLSIYSTVAEIGETLIGTLHNELYAFLG
jgi:hypothetical protein